MELVREKQNLLSLINLQKTHSHFKLLNSMKLLMLILILSLVEDLIKGLGLQGIAVVER